MEHRKPWNFQENIPMETTAIEAWEQMSIEVMVIMMHTMLLLYHKMQRMNAYYNSNIVNTYRKYGLP